MPMVGATEVVGLGADCVRRSRRVWLVVAVWISVFSESWGGGEREEVRISRCMKRLLIVGMGNETMERWWDAARNLH